MYASSLWKCAKTGGNVCTIILKIRIYYQISSMPESEPGSDFDSFHSVS